MLTVQVISTVAVYMLTAACSLLLLRRGPNRRLRLLAIVVGLVALCQTTTLLKARGVLTTDWSQMLPMFDLMVSCLCLLSIHLLKMEIRDRKTTDVRLRLAESEAPSPTRRDSKKLRATEKGARSGTVDSARDGDAAVEVPAQSPRLGNQ